MIFIFIQTSVVRISLCQRCRVCRCPDMMYSRFQWKYECLCSLFAWHRMFRVLWRQQRTERKLHSNTTTTTTTTRTNKWQAQCEVKSNEDFKKKEKYRKSWNGRNYFVLFVDEAWARVHQHRRTYRSRCSAKSVEKQSDSRLKKKNRQNTLTGCKALQRFASDAPHSTIASSLMEKFNKR